MRNGGFEAGKDSRRERREAERTPWAQGAAFRKEKGRREGGGEYEGYVRGFAKQRTRQDGRRREGGGKRKSEWLVY